MKKTVLLVDDDVDILVVLTEHLMAACDCEIVPFSSPFDALDYLTNGNDCHIIVADERMPHMSGIEFLRRAVDFGYCGHLFMFTGFSCDHLAFALLQVEIKSKNSRLRSIIIDKPELAAIAREVSEALKISGGEGES